jgi:hypothetical protein
MELITYKADIELDVAERESNQGTKAGAPLTGAPSDRRLRTQLEVCMYCAFMSKKRVNML